MADATMADAPPPPPRNTHAQLDRQRPQIAILDFGSQFSHLIARRVREANVYCELYSCLVEASVLESKQVVGVILSGGPASVYEAGAPHVSEGVWRLIERDALPVLGICYGMQELAHHFGGVVQPGAKREFGKAAVRRAAGGGAETGGLLGGLPDEFIVWMSHGDKVQAAELSTTWGCARVYITRP